jgi:hypothetical protein
MGVSVLADARHLPRDLLARHPACDLEAITLNFLGDVGTADSSKQAKGSREHSHDAPGSSAYAVCALGIRLLDL